MTRTRHLLTLIFLLGFTVLLAGLLEGCGSSVAEREKTLSTTITAVNTAKEGFLTWDEQQQDAIVAGCTPATGCTLEQGKAQLAAFRAKLEPVITAFDSLRVLIKAAVDGTASLPEVINAATNLLAVIQSVQSSSAVGPSSP